MAFTEASLENCQTTLHKIPEELVFVYYEIHKVHSNKYPTKFCTNQESTHLLYKAYTV